MKKIMLLVFLIFISVLSTCFVNADTVYLPIEYKTVRYTQENGKGTTIWYAVIPAKYKMHYAYGQDKIQSQEIPSANAKRQGATLAVNTQFIGLPIINGSTASAGTNVANYDFYITKNDSSTSAYNALNVYGVSKFSNNTGVNFKDINLGFSYYGNEVSYNGKTYYMSVYNQLVMNGASTTNTMTFLTDRHPRTWIAYDADGVQYVATAAGRDTPLLDGTKISQAGLTGSEIIAVTKKYMTSNIKTLYNLDGGGSCSFVYKGTKLSPHYDSNNTAERSVYGIFYWKAEDYKIVYDCNGGTKPSGKLSDQIVTENSTFTLSSDVCTKSGYHQNGWLDGTNVAWKSGFNGKWNYSNGQNGITNYTITLKAKWVKDGCIDFDSSIKTDDNKKIAKNISVGTTVATFKSKINDVGTITITSGNANSSDATAIKTGDKLKVVSSNGTYNYTLSVLGDFNKDGVANINDARGIFRYIINKGSIEDAVFYAADYNGDNKIRTNDVMKLMHNKYK